MTVKFEPYCQAAVFNLQDYFKETLSNDAAEGSDEEKGLVEVIFDIRNRKILEVLQKL